MLTEFTFVAVYSASPATTTLFILTGFGAASNDFIKIMGLSDDTTNAVPHTIDASYDLVWNGASFTSATLISGAAPANFTWTFGGSNANFNFTPQPAAGSGNFTLNVRILISNINTSIVLSPQ